MVQSFSIFNSNHETLYSVLVLGGWDHCYHHDWIVAGGTGNTGTQERQVFEKLSSPLALVSRDRREYRHRLKMELFFVFFVKGDVQNTLPSHFHSYFGELLTKKCPYSPWFFDANCPYGPVRLESVQFYSK